MTFTGVTLDMVGVFRLYHGDPDAWARGTHRHVMTDAEWKVINDFVLDLHLVREGLASKEFGESLTRRLNETCKDEATVNAILSLPR